MRPRSRLATLGLAAVLCIGGGGAIVGCDDEPDTAGEAVERAGEKAEDAIEKAADKTEDAAEKLKDKAEDAAERTGDALKDASR